MKERGILLPIFSLPSKYGVGDFGFEAYEFIDILSENGINSSKIVNYSRCNFYDKPYVQDFIRYLYDLQIQKDKIYIKKRWNPKPN